MKESRLTAKQSRFVEEYLVDLSATQAATRAGYSAKTAGRTGHDNLKKPEIAEAIQKRMEKRSKRIQADADYVLQRMVEIDQMDAADIMDEDGNLLPIKQWPSAWRRYISSMDVSEIKVGDGEALGVLKKIKWPDKLKNLELIGKHVTVQAFRERVTYQDDGKTFEELMAEVAPDGTDAQ